MSDSNQERTGACGPARLLPCPFCGGPAWVEGSQQTGSPLYHLVCDHDSNCLLSSSENICSGPDRDHLVTMWNTRTSSTPAMSHDRALSALDRAISMLERHSMLYEVERIPKGAIVTSRVHLDAHNDNLQVIVGTNAEDDIVASDMGATIGELELAGVEDAMQIAERVCMAHGLTVHVRQKQMYVEVEPDHMGEPMARNGATTVLDNAISALFACMAATAYRTDNLNGDSDAED